MFNRTLASAGLQLAWRAALAIVLTLSSSPGLFAQLRVARVQDSPDPATVGEVVTYSLTVNTSDPLPRDVRISVSNNASFQFLGSTADCKRSDAEQTCDITLTGSSHPVTISFTPYRSGTFLTAFALQGCSIDQTGGRVCDTPATAVRETTTVRDPVATVTAHGDSTVPNGGSGFTVRLNAPARAVGGQKVTYQVTGTATPGEDYEPLSRSVFFPPGASQVDIPISIMRGQRRESPETVVVTLDPGPSDTALSYVRGTPNSATLVIRDEAPQAGSDLFWLKSARTKKYVRSGQDQDALLSAGVPEPEPNQHAAEVFRLIRLSSRTGALQSTRNGKYVQTRSEGPPYLAAVGSSIKLAETFWMWERPEGIYLESMLNRRFVRSDPGKDGIGKLLADQQFAEDVEAFQLIPYARHGSNTWGRDTDQDGLDDGWEQALAELYRPIFIFDKDEHYWPTSARWFVQHSSRLIAESQDSPLLPPDEQQVFARTDLERDPMLVLRAHEQGTYERLGIPLLPSDLRMVEQPLTRCKEVANSNVKDGRICPYYLDLDNKDNREARRGEGAIPGTEGLPDEDRLPTMPIYAGVHKSLVDLEPNRALDTTGLLHIQYFYGFAYNAVRSFDHEGDWERLSVYVDPSIDVSRNDPTYLGSMLRGIRYYAHKKRRELVLRDNQHFPYWDGVPRVFVEDGQHAFYEKPDPGRVEGVYRDVDGDGVAYRVENVVNLGERGVAISRLGESAEDTEDREIALYFNGKFGRDVGSGLPFVAGPSRGVEGPGMRLVAPHGYSPCPLPDSNEVAIYEDPSRGGACKVLGVGEYPTSDLLDPVGNNSISEIDVGSGVRAVVFDNEQFGGRLALYEGDGYYEELGSMNDKTSSIKIMSADPHVPIGATALVAKHSDKCLDIVNASQDNGARAIQFDCNGGANQSWTFVPVGQYFRLEAQHSGKCLDVTGGSAANGAAIVQWDCHDGDNQLWSVLPLDDYYMLVSKNSGKCLDVASRSTRRGANIHQWDCYAQDNQRWIVR